MRCFSTLIQQAVWAVVIGSTVWLSPLIQAAPGDAELGFPNVELVNPGMDIVVNSTVRQPDGKIIIGGQWHTVSGTIWSGITRLNTDGTRDVTFKSRVSGTVSGMALQPDGKLLIWGGFSSVISPAPIFSETLRNSIARLNSDGSVDTTFEVTFPGFASIYAAAVQADGKIVFSGYFTQVNGIARTGLARVSSTGVLDAAFNPVLTQPFCFGLLVQPDQQIMIWGNFGAVGGVARSGPARLTSTGALDTTFDAVGQSNVRALLRQADGQYILCCGPNQQPGRLVRRVSATGVADASYAPVFDTTNGTVADNATLQADGKVIVGGQFSTINGAARNGVARLNADGTLDTSFVVSGTTRVHSVMLQEDGRVLIGGFHGLKRVENNAVTESLTAPNATSVRWMRSGPLPEVISVSFQQSTDAGATWSTLGAGTRISDGWELTGTSTSNGLLRATGLTQGGMNSASSAAIIAVEANPALTPDIAVEQPAATDLVNGAASFDLGSFELGSSSAPMTFTLRNAGSGSLKYVLASITGAHAADFSTPQLSQNTLAAGTSGTLDLTFTPKAVGPRSAVLHFTSNDPDEADFTVALTGTGLLSSNANLSSLTMTSSVMTPGFANNIISYTASVQSHVASINVTPTLVEVNATISINGTSATSGAASAVSLAVGVNVLNIVVTAQNGISTKTYTLTVTRAATAQPGDLDPTFNIASLDNSFRACATQPDGKLLLGGFFSSDPGHQGILRLNPDQTLDTSFNASLDGYLNCLMVLESGKILIAGSFTGIRQGGSGAYTPRDNIALLNADGTLDTTFNASVTITPAGNSYPGQVECMALQPDGKILVGGYINRVGATARRGIARLTAAGALDTTFNAGAITNSVDDDQTAVNSIVVQADGKIVFGGWMTSIGATPRAGIARVTSTGALDATFNPGLLSGTSLIRLLPDQRLLVSATSADNLHYGLVLISSAGVIDASYTAGLNGEATSLTLQTDGNVLFSGQFSTIYDGSTPGPTRMSLARLSPTGVLDAAFSPRATFAGGMSQTQSLLVQDNGRILVSGDFDAIDLFPRMRYARLMNSAVTQSITNIGFTTVEWTRGGALPEAEGDVSFELSTDGGTTFTVLGDGTRVSGGWQLTGQNLPVTGGILRARARVLSGYHNSSAGWSVFEQAFAPAAPKIDVEQPVNDDLADGDTINLGTLGINVLVPTVFTIRNAGGQNLTLSNVTITGTNANQFSIIDQPELSVAPLESTTFTVQARVTSAGAKTATLNIASNDTTATPFNIVLNVTGATAVPPVATTVAATGLDFDGAAVNAMRATLNGSVDANGQPREVSFEYGLTTAYGSTITLPGTFDSANPVSVSTQLTGLTPHTTYNFRVRVDGDLGNALGANRTFTTANRAPIANPDTAEALPSVGTTIAVLDDDVDADGDTLSISTRTAVTPSTAGTVAIVGRNLVFTASAAFGTGVNATATFGYRVIDGEGGFDDETVTVSLGSATLDLLAKNISSEGTAFETPSSYPVNIQTTGSWAVTEALTWAFVSPPSGRGNTVVNITVQPNTATAARTGVIKIGGVSHTITQAGVLKPTLGPLAGSSFNAIVGGAFELVIPTVNAPVTYTVTGMPPGLTLSNTTGMITGRPTMTGTAPTTYNVTVRASNASGPTAADTAGKAAATVSFTINVIPLPAGVVGTFHGLIERSSTVNVGTIPNLGARWEMTVTPLGAVSGKIVEGVTSRSFTSKLEVTADTANTPTISAAITGTALSLDLKLNALTDSLSSGVGENVLRNAGNTQSSIVTGWGNAWSTTAPIKRATQFRGPYSFAIINPATITTTNTAAPDGFGFGSFIVSETNGALRITGDLPDGSKILCDTFIGQNGEVLLYAPLHGNKGSIHGQLTVTPVNAPTDNTVVGPITWLKPTLLATDKDKAYQSGFGPLMLDAKGSTYLPPAKGLRVLGLPAPAVTPTTATNAKLAFTLGGLDLATPNSLAFNQLIRVSNPSAAGLTNTATVVPFNATTLTNPNKVAITTFTAPTGAFAGNFTLPGTPARVGPFTGQIVRIIGVNITTQGYGYFLLPTGVPNVITSPKYSGRVELTVP